MPLFAATLVPSSRPVLRAAIRAIGLMAAGAAPAAAAIAPGALFIEAAAEQTRTVVVNEKTARGPTDTDTHHGRRLRIRLRLLGTAGPPERVTVRWFFIKRDGMTGRFALHAHDSAEQTVPRGGTAELAAEAPALTVSRYAEQRGLTRTRITDGDLPHGWVVWASAEGRILATAASEPGLADWLMRNLPKPLTNGKR